MAKTSLTTRNERKDIGDYELNFEEERLIQEQSELKTTTVVIDNENSKTLKWYGKRLMLLRIFYNKSINSVALVTGFSNSYITRYEKSEIKPSDRFINAIAFMFEVPFEFFTDDNVDLRINEQLKIETVFEEPTPTQIKDTNINTKIVNHKEKTITFYHYHLNEFAFKQLIEKKIGFEDLKVNNIKFERRRKIGLDNLIANGYKIFFNYNNKNYIILFNK